MADIETFELPFANSLLWRHNIIRCVIALKGSIGGCKKNIYIPETFWFSNKQHLNYHSCWSTITTTSRKMGLFKCWNTRSYTFKIFHTTNRTDFIPIWVILIKTQNYNYIEIDPKIKVFLNEGNFLAEKFDFSLNQLSDYAIIYQKLIHA